MQIQDLADQLQSLTAEQKEDLLSKFQQVIDTEYVSKDKVADLQKQINLLVQENNEKNCQIAVKFSKQEHQTLAFQLGKNIIDVMKGEKSVKAVPKMGLNLFAESIRRKNKNELTGFKKNIATILDYKDALNEKKAKNVLIDILNIAIQKLNSDDEKKTENYVDSTFVEVEQKALVLPEVVSTSDNLQNILDLINSIKEEDNKNELFSGLLQSKYIEYPLLNKNVSNKEFLNIESDTNKLSLKSWIKDAEDIAIKINCKQVKDAKDLDSIGIVKLKFYDENNTELKKPGLTNLSWSEYLDCWYFYLKGNKDQKEETNVYEFIKPAIVDKIDISIEKWKSQSLFVQNELEILRKPSILQIIRQDYGELLGELRKKVVKEFIDKKNGKVCYVLNHTLPYQSEGYATRAQGLAKAMQNIGLDVECISRPGFPGSFLKDYKNKDLPKKELIDNVVYHRIIQPTGWRGSHNYISKAANELELKFRELRPSCVIAASDFKNALPALLAARRLGIPFIYEIRGFWEVTQESKQPDVILTSNYHLTKYLETQVALNSDYVFTLTEAMRENLISRGLNPQKIDLLPNSCNPQDFKVKDTKDQNLMKNFNIPSNVPVIGYIGTFNSYEGLDDLMHACGMLFKLGLEFRVLLVGAQPSKESASGLFALELQKIAEGYGFNNWLIMPGRIPHEVVSKYYSLIDIAPFTRKPLPVTELVSPIKPLEAMAMEKAIVVSSVNALSEMIIDGETGLVYKKGNVKDLASKLAILLNSPNIRMALGKGARKWVAKERTWEICAKKVEEKVKFFEKNFVSAQPIEKVKISGKLASQYKVAFIADEFTFNSFKDEFIPIIIEPDNWEQLFKEQKPDLFFCESAWSGVDSKRRPWQGKIYTSSNWNRENRTVLLKILAYCKKMGIPTIFWNKEDPTHFTDRVHDFIATAKEFDHVFTTAEECCGSYKSEYGVKSVYALPFATNPKLFNPIANTNRQNKVVFAGSWYANHIERSNAMEQILDSLLISGFEIEIYDRYYGSEDALHIWPERYKKYIRPGVAHEKMPEVYKASSIGLNFNTVTESSTMFARRVFELMSSNTLVVSNYSKGVDAIFGNLVVFPDKDSDRLNNLSNIDIDKIREEALNLVLSKHTYTNRWKEILTKIGVPWIEEKESFTMVYKVKNSKDIDKAIDHYQNNYAQDNNTEILLLVDDGVSPLEVSNIYQNYNRIGINVTSIHHIKNYALEGKYKPVGTKYFVYSNLEDYPSLSWIENAKLHTQYINDIGISPKNNSDAYKVVESKKINYLLGNANIFEKTMLDISKQSIKTYLV